MRLNYSEPNHKRLKPFQENSQRFHGIKRKNDMTTHDKMLIKLTSSFNNWVNLG